MSVVPRSSIDQVWLWVKLCIDNRTLDPDYTTLKKFYEWIVERASRSEDFASCKLSLLGRYYFDTSVGEFLDALRQTPNLRKIDDMSPQMLYLTMRLTDRMDYHPDTIQRAIEADHISVAVLVIDMGTEAFLQFVTERQIPLGIRTLNYLAKYNDLSTERSAEFQKMAQDLYDSLWWYRCLERLFWALFQLIWIVHSLLVFGVFLVFIAFAFLDDSTIQAIGEQLNAFIE